MKLRYTDEQKLILNWLLPGMKDNVEDLVLISLIV